MKCNVTITYGGSAEKYVCAGDLRFAGEGFSLDYDFDGDKSSLCFDGNVLTQTRRGKMRVDVTFINEMQTTCFTEDTSLGYNCLLNVNTYGIDYSKTESGLALKINYKIEDSIVILNLTAEINKEKK